MSKISFEGRSYSCDKEETLLDALLRQGREIPFSCRNGACQVCLMRATEGEPPEDAQTGLAERLQEKGYFLPCKCRPQTDLVIAVPKNSDLTCCAVIQEKEMLAEDICRILIEPSVELYYHAGQFINIKNDKAGVRSYSIASVPHQDYFLELHIKRHAQGMMSRWLVDDVQVGDEIELIRPAGENYYRAEKSEPMLLVATGTGLAPLIGIARDALYSGHSGDIFLYHGAMDQAGLYEHEKLLGLAQEFENFYYRPCLVEVETVQEAVRLGHNDLSGWWIHLSGNPDMVGDMEQLARNLGAVEERICADPFSIRQIVNAESELDLSEQHNAHQDETPYPPPSPDIWEALEEGAKLKKILDDFYDAVYEDPVMSPYFHNSTKQRAKEKVYSFYKRLFSGEKVYFGDRPRNAHHWMVISDEIFDHREAMLKSFMVKHELPSDMIDKWLTLENIYRTDIVKDKPRGRMIGGSEAPAEGYGSIVLSVAGMCDACNEEIDQGVEVHYHLRTGEVYCPNCFGKS